MASVEKVSSADEVKVVFPSPMLGRDLSFKTTPGFANFLHREVRELLENPRIECVLEETIRHQKILDGLLLEFGVFSGTTINLIARMCPDRKVYGFDSFEGLPSDWELTGTFIKLRKDIFSTQGRLPIVEPNVELIKGYFSQTLPLFLERHDGPIALLHMDCDLYSSTNDVLTLCSHRFVPGTIIVFDEFFDYLHEARAFFDFLSKTGTRFEWLGHGGDGGLSNDPHAIGLIKKNMNWLQRTITHGMSLVSKMKHRKNSMPAAAAVVLL